MGGLAVVGDARVALEALAAARRRASTTSTRRRIAKLKAAWEREVDAAFGARWRTPAHGAERRVIGALNEVTTIGTSSSCAAGSLHGELHKLWARATRSSSATSSTGYSCMGYEIPRGIGVKLARRTATWFVIVWRRAAT